MPLVQTRGAASAQGFGEFAQATAVNYIEDVFSTYLVTGDGSAPAVNNGIDLSGKGGLVWTKKRSAAGSHSLFDTARGANLRLISNDTAAQDSVNLSFTTTGFSNYTLDSGVTYASWSWAKAPKFFDVVTYTGDNVIGRQIPHNLGSVPGCIIVKQTNAAREWAVYHTSLGNTKYINLNSAGGASTSTYWNNTSPTSTNFTVGDWGAVNQAGSTYVAYIFAHDAGGFGLAGTDNVISCGTFTGSASGTNVNLGWEPQWVLIKRSSGNTDNWRIYDNMRGMTASNGGQLLYADTAGSETTNSRISVNATGFGFVDDDAYGNIYIAIRRGPMKVPTVGTSVFSPTLVTGNGTNDRQITGVGFPPDLLIGKTRSSVQQPLWYDKLRGKGRWLESNNTLAEQTLGGGSEGLMLQDGFVVDFNYGSLNSSGITYIDWCMRRAPSFFDEVCYTGTGVARTVTHNLTVAPELMIVKQRGGTTDWVAYVQPLGNTVILAPNLNIAQLTFPNGWNNTSPTSTEFTVGISGVVNASAGTYVAYLFATCAGVSKVGSYTGNGSSQTINCGFTGGARFVMVKATSTTGNWIVADSARGIVAGNDPALYLNSTAAEVTGLDWIDADNSGFVVNETATIAANTNGVTYIFLAIA